MDAHVDKHMDEHANEHVDEHVKGHTNGIAQAAAMLKEARYPIALTGAGASTPSGIPDFRSPGSGMWEQFNPMEVASLYAFRRHPDRFYDWIRPMVETLLAAQPNPFHTALAELEAHGRLRAIITQNIDTLHQKAGAREVLELHGHMREATCISCYHVVPTRDILDRFLDSNDVPRCSKCGGVIKPNVVLFGEQLPIQVVNAAMAHVRKADLMLVAGSSLEVMPASQVPLRVHEQGGRLIVVNLTPTYVDELADVVIHGDVAQVMPRITQTCLRE